MFSHCKSMGASDPRDGAIFDPRVMVSRNFKEDYYILLHTKYESSGPCGFGEEDFFFSHCKSMGAINPIALMHLLLISHYLLFQYLHLFIGSSSCNI